MNPLADFSTIALRLALALGVGAVLGLNRWLHHKAAGIRTHALVAIGACVAMLLFAGDDPAAALQAQSRVLQGLVAGIGFLGAGVILHDRNSQKVHGLTTAASVWACALLGAAFGSGQYAVGGLGLAAIVLVLTLGGRLERYTGAWLGSPRQSEQSEQSEVSPEESEP